MSPRTAPLRSAAQRSDATECLRLRLRLCMSACDRLCLGVFVYGHGRVGAFMRACALMRVCVCVCVCV